MDMTQLKPGDRITRLLAGEIPVRMRVLRVAGDLVYCTLPSITGKVAARRSLIWAFDRTTGAEIDDSLGWGPAYGVTGSFLVPDYDPRARRWREMADNEDREPVWKIIEITEPVEGLDELYEHDRAHYADAVAEQILGPVGRMISASKASYSDRHPDNVPVFNANICTAGRGKIWFGDLDLTLDEPQLLALAQALAQRVYVLYERAARFANADGPALHEAVVAVGPDATVQLDRWTMRAPDGRLRPRRRIG